MFAFFINPIGASAINPGTQNLGPIHPHHPSSRGAFTLTSVVSSTGPALPNWILPSRRCRLPEATGELRSGSSGRNIVEQERIVYWYRLRDSLPAGANTRKKANIKLTITQATRLLDAEVHELRGKITGFDPTWAGRSHGQGLNQRGDKARAIGPGRYGMGVISSGIGVAGFWCWLKGFWLQYR